MLFLSPCHSSLVTSSLSLSLFSSVPVKRMAPGALADLVLDFTGAKQGEDVSFQSGQMRAAGAFAVFAVRTSVDQAFDPALQGSAFAALLPLKARELPPGYVERRL